MEAAPIFKELADRKAVVEVFRTVLARHGIELEMDRMDFHLRDKMITELSYKPAGLSEMVLDHMFPKEPAPSTVYHYTGFGGFQGIVSSGELRLYPVRKRLGEGGELEAFATAHGLHGYLKTPEGEEFYKILSDDLFYASLTRVPPKDPSTMWGGFAKVTGVRLEFLVTPKPLSELRPVHYEPPFPPKKWSPPPTLLNKINDALKEEKFPPFSPSTISRIGAFYLNDTVSSEDEVRLLIKRHRDGVDHTRNDGNFDYWPIPIGQEYKHCDLQLLGVHVSPDGDRGAVQAALSGTRFSNIPVTGP
ncbi:hypothetical protein [Sinorhizobium meliloti]|uniref:hypothetical protein n=1 Tax=Rhizobium meliloti TaxID=382 RepID=UPI000FDC53A4|nr:hypothetical protein [Sinorhizobium meliloti]RVJ46120.1 hypothetical protein CN175_29215 [Sinorhizobium meliloti]